MAQTDDIPIVAVDGGGTSCRFALLHAGRRHEAKLGGANVMTDCDRAIRTIRDGISGLAAEAGLGETGLARAVAYLGLAGVRSEDLARRVAGALAVGKVLVEDDRPSTVVAAFGSGDGTVAGIGTGSFVARQREGAISALGGWGFHLGDEASGAWLGRLALARCLHAIDGICAPSPLTDSLLAEFGDRPDRMMEFARDARPAEFGRFAPRVIEAAAAGDANGRVLMQRGADYIMDAARALGWQPGEALCLAGGIGPHYREYLPAEAAGAVTAPRGSTLDGALELAGRLAAGALEPMR
ncbi:MAG: ATPase [Alphaproteobacteria bacterium]|nr:MAG: ATPase [Alphaproteobacteria bacterium]